MPYAVIDPDGNVRDLVPEFDDAVEVAGQIAPFVTVENGPSDGIPPGLGDLGAVNMRRPEHALKMSGLSKTSLPSDHTMSLGEAHKRLLPFFPTRRFVKRREGRLVNAWVPVTSYDTPQKMSERLLGQNYKTAKKDLSYEINTDVQGLSLLPARSLKTQRGFEKINACVGASPACIASCLVYSGHNTIDPYNAVVKAARMKALIREPVAFLRMLGENIARHSKIREAAPYVRLNVFSDLPWELFCPDLFDAFALLSFYDYTKVENRSPPGNYDLTFSFSGINQPQVAHELSRGRRIAVVFVPPKRVPAEGRARGEGLPSYVDVGELFGSNLGNLPVIDGDVSDVRPRDPAPSIVGLRWKIPMGRQEAAFAQAQEAAFAVPVLEYNGALIASQSARQEPIYDHDDVDEEAEEARWQTVAAR